MSPAVAEEAPAEHLTGAAPRSEPETWRDDPALQTCDGSDDLLRWLERTAVDPSDVARIHGVPLGRVYLLAEEARRRAETWSQLARALEARPARAR
jgi:hypothetical protein